MKKVSVFWFRRDLRLSDNHGLHQAIRSGYPVLPLFIFDTEILDDLPDRRDARVGFIYKTLQAMHKSLRCVGSGLLIRHGKPETIFRELTEEYAVQAVYTNRDYEPYAKERDAAIASYLAAQAIGFFDFKDHVIFERGEVLAGNGTPYKVFTPYKNKWLATLVTQPLKTFSINLAATLFYQFKPEFPALAAIGFEPADLPIPSPDLPEAIIRAYDQHRDFPGRSGTSRLGIHLRFGTLSIRQAVASAQRLNATWLNELIWRDFYSMILDFFPQVATQAFKTQYDSIPWRKDADAFEKWCLGQTGYPIVDAGMRELNATGSMHKRVRMITASFLTKHLLIDWRWGEAYFAGKLLDYDLASNNGGWQWAAGTGTDAQPYFRIFNPYSQTTKFDGEQLYIQKWVPEVNTPDYPAPMVDHKTARERALITYKAALNKVSSG